MRELLRLALGNNQLANRNPLKYIRLHAEIVKIIYIQNLIWPKKCYD